MGAGDDGSVDVVRGGVDVLAPTANGRPVRRHATAGLALSLLLAALTACGFGSPDPAGSGGVVGHMSGTSDVEGQSGDSAIGGGGLAVLPMAAMDGAFWELTGEERVVDPHAWSYLAPSLSRDQVTRLGGSVAPIDEDGDFRIHARPGEHAVCYWRTGVGGQVTGCSAIELPTDGELRATWGEAGFHIEVAG